MQAKKSKKSNNSSSFEEIEKKVNKLTARLKVSIFLLLLIALAGGFFIFSSVNFKMVANALLNPYNKTSGSSLTHDEWNNLDDDFAYVNQCTRKRSVISTNDSVIYCPAGYPKLLSCNGVDDQAPALAQTSLAGYCENDGLCNASGAIPVQYKRDTLGTDNMYLESVINSAGLEGCWQYDDQHTHSAYRLDIVCCK